MDRRESDTVVGLLSSRIENVAEETKGVATSLQEHVTECAKMQKLVLVVGCLTLGAVVATSPKAEKLISLIIGVLS